MGLFVDRVASQSYPGIEASRSVTGGGSRLAAGRGSIRTAIFMFCLALSAIAAALGGYATLGIRHAGDLVAKTFDESLMSINYARAAGADFAAMRVAASQRLLSLDPAARARFDAEIEQLSKTLLEDVTIAAERSQSARAAKAAAKVQEAAMAWLVLQRPGPAEHVLTSDTNSPEGSEVDRLSNVVNQQVELLVNYTAGDGFLFRQRALAAIKRDQQLNVAGLTIALVLSGLFSWLLTRRIVGPVAIASKAAKSIADGDLNAEIPEGGNDELGTLLTAMGRMRNNIRAMVDQEVAQRRSAQARLSDALENSREGVVLLDADGQIALANSRASEFIRLAPHLVHSDLVRLEHGSNDETSLVGIDAASSDTEGLASEAHLSDGRWLRVSRSPTQEGGVILVYSDITSLKQQKAELHATNLRLDAALTHMSQGLCLYDSAARLQVVNRRFCEIFDILPELVRPGMTFEDVLSLSVAAGNHGSRTAADLRVDLEQFLARRDGGNHLQHLSDGRVVSIAHRSTSDGGWLISCEDVTEQQTAQSQIAFMARHDALTKLPNRSLFAEQVERAIAEAGRGSGFAVFCIDLDNFKQINDTLGHPVGDGLLCAVADRLSSCVREVDTVARLGGDEFAIVQSDIQNSEDAERLARRIVECVGAPYELNGHRVIAGCSVGISLAPSDGTTREKLLKNADMALYRSKMDGRGTWRFFEPAMDASLQKRRSVELDLREALERDEFALFYQPIYDLRLDRISGFEALLRWHHPKKGLVPPDQFIPIAEDIGLINALGEWVLNQACEQAANWPSELKIAVNVSPTQFRDARLAEVIAKALNASKLTPKRLELEITESVLLGNSAETIAMLHELKARGLRIALDDFGTGYSSLSYLRSFPFDKLKIDQSFVRDATTVSGSKLIVRAITSLGKSLGMTTTAEGVETIEQLNQMKTEGCNEAQGYLIGRPVPATDVAATILALRNGLKRNHRRSAMAS